MPRRVDADRCDPLVRRPRDDHGVKRRVFPGRAQRAAREQRTWGRPQARTRQRRGAPASWGIPDHDTNVSIGVCIQSRVDATIESNSPTRAHRAPFASPWSDGVRFLLNAPTMGCRVLTLAFALLGAASVQGCYRSASFAPRDIANWNLDGTSQSVDVVKRDGERVHIDHYDSLVVVEGERRGIHHWWQKEHEFESPLHAELRDDELEIRNVSEHRAIPTTQIREITFYKYAPERTAIVLGISSLAAAFVATILASRVEKPTSDVDNRAMQYMLATGGAVLTFGAVLAISLPLSSGLGEKSTAPQRAKSEPPAR